MARPHAVVVGPLQMNCYIWPCAPGECIVVDPGAEAERIVAELNLLDRRPVAVTLTHGHPDHLGAVGEIARRFDTPVYLHPGDMMWIELLKGEWMYDFGPRPENWPEFIAYPERLEYSELKLRILPLPGHSRGSVVLYSAADSCACVGDVLFTGSIGRTDLPGGDEEQLFRGLEEILFTLPPDTVVLPGHGPATTLARERTDNPFLAW